ncbi:MAG: twin-arginine translocation signal domain-containing protein [Planctomycetaceae bacterium]|nr:twin-arginine translocation signal domain-containing protein [Planctomycetaceae bacterium]
MSEKNDKGLSRRDLLKGTGMAVSATALAGSLAPHLYAAEDNTIRVALIGCGGRGTGAASQSLSTTSGPIKLVAMADVFPEKLSDSHARLQEAFKDQVDVPPDRRHVGFDAYKLAMDALRPGDVAIMATPPAFRWVHFTYAIEKGLNCFMEKPVTVDGPSSRRMFALGEESVKKNLKVGIGLMCRHCAARGELFDRIQGGEIGDITLLRAYRNAGPTGHAFTLPKPEEENELMYQIKRFHAFLWASGGAYSDFLIHNIDECCWMKDAWPVEAKAIGGRHYRGEFIDQNFDAYGVEYTFADGAKLHLEGRYMEGCHNEFASYAHGTKGCAVISTASHTPAKPRTYKGQAFRKEDLIWAWEGEEPNPYQLEWDHLIEAIRNDKPYNEVKRGVEASLVTVMGRIASHTGKVVTYDDALNHEHELGPDIDKLVLNGPAPIQAGPDGKYPIPLPGLNGNREF